MSRLRPNLCRHVERGCALPMLIILSEERSEESKDPYSYYEA